MKKKAVKNKTPKVTVCVVTYNQEGYIRQCLQSIVEQKVDFDFEVIVGDDFSTDATKSIVQEFHLKYPEIIKPVYRNCNVGAFKNYVEIHNAARGQYVAHIDGDDLMLPGKLYLQAKYLDENEDCTVVWHKVRCFNDQGYYSDDNYINYEKLFPDSKIIFDDALAIGSVAANSSCMYRKSARVTKNPDFMTLDLYYSWEYLSSGWGHVLPEVLGKYRIAANGAFTTNSSRKLRQLNAHHIEYYFNKYPERRKAVFIFSLTNMLTDLKNLRVTTFLFMKIALKAFSLAGLIRMPSHLNRVRYFRAPILRK